MKAYLKSNRKVIVDVELLDSYSDCIVYADKNTGKLYTEEELDFVEYYGG